MKSLRDEAKQSQSSKMERMIGRALTSSNMAPEPKVNPKTSTKAMGGVVARATGGAVNASIPGRASGGRLDKKGRKASTNINIVIAPGDKAPMPPGAGIVPPGAAPVLPPMARPLMPAPGAMPLGAPPMGPGGPPMRARGGKVYPKMEAGAGSGEGREEKIAKYGKNAKA